MIMATAFQQAMCSNQLHGYGDSLSCCEELRNFAMITKLCSFGTSKMPLKKANCRYNRTKVFVVRASVSDSMLSSLDSSGHDSWKTTDESTLILLRHGESMWNEKNLFTGCVDVPLTNKGVIEAIEAGKRIRNIPIDIIYTSALVRSQMTAMLALTQHCCEKVPIFLHNETEQATLWSQIYSEDTKKQSIPVIKAWQLNERMYGDLQGLNKQETAERFGKEQVYKWRRSYYVRPPNGESLEMCLERAVSYFKEQVEPQLLAGRHLMVVAHANSLRSIIMYLDNLTPQEVIDLELSTGVPMLYIYKNGEFTRRGSPPAPTEAGVYSYTWNLALHRQMFDQMS
ncbi:Phosphoglycerate mutase (2,3-diphosphoglycerate-dependent) [Heracleum sosnowskyi]|uniref:phosphoglycerate mutase (2,3-diphosphoglycerate-dependent) n=1 Tax=Heracleum sosnowskyi TaxID=360622 RepID=A0AAD8M6V7_9APIA|nr:Phosphoglycerate mutase (2,3-diphosphoglycerate-dependent) [Heracleum sosnowskyi]